MQGETLGVPDYMKYLCSHEIAINGDMRGLLPKLMIINILDLPVEKCHMNGFIFVWHTCRVRNRIL